MAPKEISEALADIHEVLTAIKITLAEQHAVLQEHQRRSSLNEALLAAFRLEFEPVKQHVVIVGAVTKAFLVALGAAGTVTGVVVGLYKAFGGP